MTVAELIASLRRQPPEATVVYPDPEWTAGDEIETVTPVRRQLVAVDGVWRFSGAVDRVTAVVLE